ncbi:OsmC family protein [Streptomyces sp. NBC_00019]|uniref:OsmC family protein n=1 Tax=Streptomyces sp. NBC_00019 TaxID=2975623 RepID=UPI003246C3D7
MNTASPPRNTRVPPPARVPAEPPGRLEVTHVANRAFAVFVRDHELTVDQPVEAGGDNDGPTPVELFVASLASCVASGAARFLQLLGQPYPHLRVRPTSRRPAARPRASRPCACGSCSPTGSPRPYSKVCVRSSATVPSTPCCASRRGSASSSSPDAPPGSDNRPSPFHAVPNGPTVEAS